MAEKNDGSHQRNKIQPTPSLLLGNKLHVQTKQVLNNVYNFMKDEADKGLWQPKEHPSTRVLRATGVSKSIYHIILNEYKLIQAGKKTSFATPGRTKLRFKPKPASIDGKEHIVRQLLHELYLRKNANFSMKNIHSKVIKAAGFKGNIGSLHKAVAELGFQPVVLRNHSGKRFLREKTHVRNGRLSYLRKMTAYRQEGRPIVFLGETYFNSFVVDRTTKGKSQQVTILHAGGDDGLIPSAGRIVETVLTSKENRTGITCRMYEDWLTNELIPKLAPRSVLVLNAGAAYNSEQVNPTPGCYSPKAVVQEWLEQQKIPYNQRMLAPELYELVKVHKPKDPTYRLDCLVEPDHTILRLPRYHNDLNPMEQVWEILRRVVAEKVTKFNVDEVKKVVTEKLDSIPRSEWTDLCKVAKEAEVRYLENEYKLDLALDNYEISLDDESEVSDEEASNTHADEQEDQLT